MIRSQTDRLLIPLLIALALGARQARAAGPIACPYSQNGEPFAGVVLKIDGDLEHLDDIVYETARTLVRQAHILVKKPEQSEARCQYRNGPDLSIPLGAGSRTCAMVFQKTSPDVAPEKLAFWCN